MYKKENEAENCSLQIMSKTLKHKVHVKKLPTYTNAWHDTRTKSIILYLHQHFVLQCTAG